MLCNAQVISLVLTALPLLTSAAPTGNWTLSSRAAAKAWKATDKYEGAKFFDSFDFFSAADPTHGIVKYLNEADAKSKGLAKIANNVVTLGVDSKTKLQSGQPRDSTRVSSKKKYNGGLFLYDVQKMPVGCSTWPAVWTVGGNWPNQGEIDLLEGVNQGPNAKGGNQITMHTGPGCSIDKSAAITGKLTDHLSCASSGADNSGCATLDSDPASFGNAFNKNGGGVIAQLWDNEGIRVWFWPRSKIAADIKSGAPKPAGWGKPISFTKFGGSCSASHFKDHVITINTSICGDWAGADGAYKASGCPGTCAEAAANPANFKDAQWEINYIHVFQ